MIFEADLKLLKPDDKNLKSIKEEIKNKLKDIPADITSDK
jgi:hypothetical protein